MIRRRLLAPPTEEGEHHDDDGPPTRRRVRRDPVISRRFVERQEALARIVERPASRTRRKRRS
jgi:hypothetical protein